jgi:hypothetical protein
MGKKSGSGSGMNNPDPQHWKKGRKKLPIIITSNNQTVSCAESAMYFVTEVGDRWLHQPGCWQKSCVCTWNVRRVAATNWLLRNAENGPVTGSRGKEPVFVPGIGAWWLSLASICGKDPVYIPGKDPVFVPTWQGPCIST